MSFFQDLKKTETCFFDHVAKKQNGMIHYIQVDYYTLYQYQYLK